MRTLSILFSVVALLGAALASPVETQEVQCELGEKGLLRAADVEPYVWWACHNNTKPCCCVKAVRGAYESEVGFVAAWNAGNATLAALYYAVDAVVIFGPAGTPAVRGRAAIQEVLEGLVSQFTISVDIEALYSYAVTCPCTVVAYGIGPIVLTPRAGGDPQTQPIQFTISFTRNGNWCEGSEEPKWLKAEESNIFLLPL